MPGNSRSTIMETLQESLPAPRTVDSIDTDVMPVNVESDDTRGNSGGADPDAGGSHGPESRISG